MNQGRSKSAQKDVVQYSAFPDIMYDMPLTWKEKEQQRKLLLRNKKIQDYCFMIEVAITIGILWLIVPQLIERVL